MDSHPDELRADFQQYYGLDLDGMGRDYSTLHAAVLATQLPEGSRLARAIEPDAVWTLDRALMAVVANDLNWLVWSKSRDGQKGRNKPRIIGPKDADRDNTRHIRGMAMEPDELMAELERLHGGGGVNG